MELRTFVSISGALVGGTSCTGVKRQTVLLGLRPPGVRSSTLKAFLSSKAAESSITALLRFTPLKTRDLIKNNQKKHSWTDSDCLSPSPVNFTLPAASQYLIFSPLNNQVNFSYRELLPLPVLRLTPGPSPLPCTIINSTHQW